MQRSWYIHNIFYNMGVEPKIGEFYPPKWMVYDGSKPYYNSWFGGTPFFENTHISTGGLEILLPTSPKRCSFAATW